MDVSFIEWSLVMELVAESMFEFWAFRKVIILQNWIRSL